MLNQKMSLKWYGVGAALLVCVSIGLFMYSRCIQNIYKEHIIKSTLYVVHNIADSLLAAASTAQDRSTMFATIEKCIRIPNIRVVVYDTDRACWMHTGMPNLASTDGRRPGPPLHMNNTYDITNDPLSTILDTCNRCPRGIIEYENDLSSEKQWVHNLSGYVTGSSRFVLCVEWIEHTHTSATGGPEPGC